MESISFILASNWISIPVGSLLLTWILRTGVTNNVRYKEFKHKAKQLYRLIFL
jgi:hypothetical protein